MQHMKKTWMKGKTKVAAVLAMGSAALAMSPLSALADVKTDANPTGGSKAFSFGLANPLTGVNNIQDLIVKIIGAIITVLGPFVVIMFIYSGFLFVQASGNEEKIAKAKQTLMYTLIGAALILGAKGIALAISNTVTQF